MTIGYGFNKGTVAYLENEDFDATGKLLIKSDKPVFIMIGGSFCGWCRAAAPEYEQFAQSAAGIVFPATIQIDGSPSEKELNKRLRNFIPNYQGVPMFIVYKNGKFFKEYNGERKAKDLLEFAKTI